MASGSFSSSKGADNTEVMMNSHQESNLVLTTSSVPSQHHHSIAPMMQSNEPAVPSYPEADIEIEVSPATLLDANRFVCHVCYKGFQREQNLTLHRRVHNLPFHLKTRAAKDAGPRKLYLCPELTCINHNRSHALGDFGGLKKHYLRKHSNDKKHKCDNCSKSYAVASDLRAHSKNCITKKYNCECGSRFSSYSKFSHHREYCDEQVLEDAASTLNSDMSINSLSIGNNNSTNSISSTTSYLPSSYVGDNSIRSISNINNNSLIGSTTSYIPISAMGSNNINNLTDSTMSHLPTFNMGHRSIQSISNNNSHIGLTTPYLGPQISSSQNQTNQSQFCRIITEHESLMNDPSGSLNLARIPSNISSLSSTLQNQHEFQEKTGMGYYTNLMMSVECNNVNPENTSFMGDVSHYGSAEGSNLYSGSGSSSSEVRGFSMREEHRIPVGTPNLVANKDLCDSTSRNSSASNMVQPYVWSSSSYGGFIMPQEHNSLFGSEHFGIAENSGFHDILNSLHNPVTGRGVGSSAMIVDVGSSYQQGNYSGYIDGSGHIDYGAGREVLNSGTLGATTGAVAPYEEQYWNENGCEF